MAGRQDPEGIKDLPRPCHSIVKLPRVVDASSRLVGNLIAIMNPDRRTFLKLSAAAGAVVTLGVKPGTLLGATSKGAVKPLRILILGGTGFTGPFQVRYALDRGHKVTVFNRGKTHPGELPNGVEQLLGDRNGKLDALKGRKWDVVIDVPTSLPVWVRDAAAVLKGNVDRYVFISTVSVYVDTNKGYDETGPLAKYEGPDPYKETIEAMRASGYKTYGPLKALSEQEAEKAFPGKALIIRPGLIVGPRDETDRFTYWPVRIDRGGEVLAPGDPGDPVQIIDGRDLAEWIIRMVEQGESGIYNAVGPASPLTMGAMLDGIKGALKSDAKFTWATTEFLKEEKVEAWSDMPVWTGDESGMARTSNQKAVAKGLTFRPLADTVRDTLEWFKKQTPERQSKLKAGITSEREKEVLEAWHAKEQ
jgi:2'-hydroxyisoflavone reductase